MNGEPLNPDRRPIKSRESSWAKSVASHLDSMGISPNQISVAGMVAGIGAGVCLASTAQAPSIAVALWSAAAILIVLRLLANMFDGMVAISSGKTSRVGEIYNEIPDRVSDIAVFVGAGYSAGGSAELGFAAACVAVLVAYVRAAAKVAGAPSDFSGPMAKQQRMAAMVVACAVSASVALATQRFTFTWGPDGDWGVTAIALCIVTLGGLITAARRVMRASVVLRSGA